MKSLIRALALAAVLAVAACAATPIALDTEQQGGVQAAQTYLNGLAAFSAHFVQQGALGAGSGMLWVERPGRLRLRYDAPPGSPGGKDMVAAAGLLVAYDPSNGATTTTPVSRTPLGLLLAPHIALSGQVAVTGYAEDGGRLRLTLRDGAHPEQGTLAVTLLKAPLRLAQVTATDRLGRALTLTLDGLDVSPALPTGLFARPGPGPDH